MMHKKMETTIELFSPVLDNQNKKKIQDEMEALLVLALRFRVFVPLLRALQGI